jgi:GNAT superfamily N-acetyltransferase
MRNKIKIENLNANEYQNLVVELLKKIFPNNDVKKEWDSVSFDKKRSDHKDVYAPRIDIAVGPFNTRSNIRNNYDHTAIMKNCLLVQRLNQQYDLIWNDLSKCFLAIEIVFSGSSKHVMGDFLNATSIGAVGIIVSRGERHKKATRIRKYLSQLEYNKRLDKRSLRNLMVFSDSSFIHFLEDLCTPDRLKKFVIKKYYRIDFKSRMLRKSFDLDSNIFWDGLHVDCDDLKIFSVFGFKAKKFVRNYYVVFPVTKYTSPCQFQFYEFIDNFSKEKIRIINIIDIAINVDYRSKGIGSAILNIIENIARENSCKYICGELGDDMIDEPLESQKRFFKREGFDLKYDKRGEFSCWFVIKKL